MLDHKGAKAQANLIFILIFIDNRGIIHKFSIEKTVFFVLQVTKTIYLVWIHFFNEKKWRKNILHFDYQNFCLCFFKINLSIINFVFLHILHINSLLDNIVWSFFSSKATFVVYLSVCMSANRILKLICMLSYKLSTI